MNQYQHGGEIYDKEIALDFSVNVNPLGLPEKVKETLIDQVDQFMLYPDNQCLALREEIAAYEKIKKESVICGNGASDLIFRLCFSLKPKKALIPAPTFSEYEKALLGAGCEVSYYNLKEADGFQVNRDLINRLEDSYDMLFLCNPNNPVGNRIEPDILIEVLKACVKHHILLVVDECFLEFTENSGAYSLKEHVTNQENLFILKAFTKLYAMAGLRLGYGLCGNRTLLENMRNIGPAWNVSVPAQLAGITALKQMEYREATNKLMKTERDFLYKGLLSLGLRVFEPAANYIFFHSRETLYEEMLRKKILIRQCGNYHQLNREYYRVAVRTREENEVLLYNLKECLGKEL